LGNPRVAPTKTAYHCITRFERQNSSGVFLMGCALVWLAVIRQVVSMRDTHPANPRLALAKATRSHLHAFGIDWNDTSGQNNGHYAPFNWQA
jgi:hypothetical protein